MYLGSDAMALAPFTVAAELSARWRLGGDHAARASPSATARMRSCAAKRSCRRRRRCWSTRAIIAISWPRKSTSSPRPFRTRSATMWTWAARRSALRETLPFDFAKLTRLTISACGTAYYAGLIAKYWFERYARLPVDVDVASEFRYREPPLEAGGLSALHFAVGRDGRHAGGAALLRARRASTWPRWSMSRSRRSRAKARWCSRRCAGPRSAWPRPRR